MSRDLCRYTRSVDSPGIVEHRPYFFLTGDECKCKNACKQAQVIDSYKSLLVLGKRAAMQKYCITVKATV